ncbi:MAG: bifunctional 4-hydroxy-2-oxoglutarate aldolase/2-dehydro-3-deoxy-phosphogluconate aldolase [Bacteroidota bacterium]
MTARAETLQRILDGKIIAVIRFDSADQAAGIIDIIVSAGIAAVEITLTTDGAIGLIERLAGRDDLLIGAGTVLKKSRAKAVFDAGALFYASPVFDPRLVATAHQAGCVAMPGALTPTEVMAAWRGAADIVKLFPMPAEGARYLSAIRAPLPDIPIAPSGGVSLETAEALLRAGAAALNVGTWLTHEPDGTISDEKIIRDRAESLVALVRRVAGEIAVTES